MVSDRHEELEGEEPEGSKAEFPGQPEPVMPQDADPLMHAHLEAARKRPVAQNDSAQRNAQILGDAATKSDAIKAEAAAEVSRQNREADAEVLEVEHSADKDDDEDE